MWVDLETRKTYLVFCNILGFKAMPHLYHTLLHCHWNLIISPLPLSLQFHWILSAKTGQPEYKFMKQFMKTHFRDHHPTRPPWYNGWLQIWIATQVLQMAEFVSYCTLIHAYHVSSNYTLNADFQTRLRYFCHVLMVRWYIFIHCL